MADELGTDKALDKVIASVDMNGVLGTNGCKAMNGRHGRWAA